MRWLVVVSLAACGGKSAAPPPAVANSATARVEEPLCTDTVVRHPPVVEPALVISNETLIGRAIRDHQIVLTQCYLERLRYEPELGGKVTLELTVGPDGRATKIHTIGFDERLDRCLCEKLAAIDYGSVSSGETKVRYPLHFVPPAM